MSNDQNEKIIGQAWGLHRNAQNEEAVATFETVLRQDPQNIDANYGIGLAYKGIGDTTRAIEHLTKAYEETIKSLGELRQAAEKEGLHIANNLNTTLDDRYMMLIRMTYQRLTELGVNVKAIEEAIF